MMVSLEITFHMVKDSSSNGRIYFTRELGSMENLKAKEELILPTKCTMKASLRKEIWMEKDTLS